MKLQVEVTASALNVRSMAKKVDPPKGTFKKGDGFTVDKLENGWYRLLTNKIGSGESWVSAAYVKIVKDLEGKTPAKADTSKTGKPVDGEKITTAKSGGLDAQLLNMLTEKAGQSRNNVGGSTRLFGAPHQYLPQTDFRVDEQDGIGRKYIETTINEAPIVYLLPGKPNYLPDLNEAQRSGMTQFLLGKGVTQADKNVVNQLTGNKDIRYFDFITDYAVYMRYVNLMCRFSAVQLGIGDVMAPNSVFQYRFYDWANYRYLNSYKTKDDPAKKNLFDNTMTFVQSMTTKVADELFGEYRYTQFYVEPTNSFQESNNNNTVQSKMESAFDGASGIVKEFAFLSNALDAKAVDGARNTFAKEMGEVEEQMKANTGVEFFRRLTGMGSNILSGGNIVFPQLWGDSSYNKSYNLSIKLVSPYGDTESIYLNIIVPLMHLMALAMPRQTSANSYASPFLVKAFSKGWFSCEMGIIDSISIDKGGQGSWNANGLPTEMTVNLTIKDLYSNMMITPNSNPGLFFQNQGLTEFLAVTCGVDISRPRVMLQVEGILSTLFNSVKDIIPNLYRDIMDDIRNSFSNLLRLP